MAVKADKVRGGIQYRNAELQRQSFNKEARTVRCIISTENPVRTYVGWKLANEVLTHDSTAVDLSFARSGAPILRQHNPHDVIGVMEDVQISDRKLEAVIRFSKSTEGERAMMDVEDNISRFMSIGYRVFKYEVDEDEENYRATQWSLLEASIVAIPADPSARIQRSERDEHEISIMNRAQINREQTPATGGGGAPNIVTQADLSREVDEAREILGVMAQYQRTHPSIVERGEKAIKDKTPIAKFLRETMELVKTAPEGQTISAPSIGDGMPSPNRGERSVGARLVEDKNFRAAIGARKFKGISIDLPDAFQFRADQSLLTRATLNAGTEGISGSSGLNIDLQKTFNLLGTQQLYIADLFAQGTTTSDQVRIVREESYTNAATRVAEGGNKPEASLELVVANFTVEKTAAFLNVTEEMMSDFAQAASFVNGRLSYMVQALEDQHLVSGTGSSQITGILNTSGIQTQAGGTNTVDAILRAKAKVEGSTGVGFGMADAILMNTLDYLNVRLSKDGNGQYLFGGPAYSPYGVGGYSNVGTMWGLPVVSTTSIAQGTALVGAFRTAAQIFRRQGLTIKTTDAHASNFIANILTVLAEQRMALAVYQPNKFCTVTGIPAGV